ncbi:hypothetical protein [Sutterella sp.]|uniref:hypothetical protein n=1 Tax=Sutterella sp. TaxID=1981025 RepID=UPI0026DFFA90|nr:hypothetical protein [Sutterella sp.]MDO5531820.1 hypothetical protein [Sutterella sp.]
MAYTEYKMDMEKIRERVKEMTENLRRNKGREDLARHGSGVIYWRLHDKPSSYVGYGPYWFALKAVLRRNGFDLGPANDPETELAYSGKTDEETMVMAETFLEIYDETFFQGTRTFMLDGESGADWTLFDPDMEIWAKDVEIELW